MSRSSRSRALFWLARRSDDLGLRSLAVPAIAPRTSMAIRAALAQKVLATGERLALAPRVGGGDVEWVLCEGHEKNDCASASTDPL